MRLPWRTIAVVALRGGAWLASSACIVMATGQYGSVARTLAAEVDQQGTQLKSDEGGWQPTRRVRSSATADSQPTVDSSTAKASEATAEAQTDLPKSRIGTSAAAAPSAAASTNRQNRPYPDRRVRRAVGSAPDVQSANDRQASRGEMNYGFSSERPGPMTRTSFADIAQNESPRYRTATRQSYESPYASPRARGGASYRMTGHEQMPTPAEEIPARPGGSVMYERGPEAWDGDDSYGGSCNSCGSHCNRCSRCGSCDCDDCEPCDDCRWVPPDWSDNITVFGGVHAFKGSVDQGLNGNFGFHEGANMGVAVCRDWCIGIQAGANFVQSDFMGNAIIEDDRNQTFFTLGFFRRAPSCGGLQGGVVGDWLRDEYNVFTNVTQLRAELSCVNECGNEIGFWGTRHTKGDRDEIENSDQEFVSWRAVDQCNLFFRRHFCRGGEGRIWGGFTGHGDGLIGADMRIPFARSFAIEPSFQYLIPKKDDDSFAQEGFNVSINLVWYIHCRARVADCSPFRPLFNVADNGTFMIQTDREPVQ